VDNEEFPVMIKISTASTPTNRHGGQIQQHGIESLHGAP